jgi:hypothetical protein
LDKICCHFIAFCIGLLAFAAGAWPIFLALGAMVSLANIDRRCFPNGVKPGWLLSGVISGAFIGVFFTDACDGSPYQILDFSIHIINGAILGTGIGMLIDLTLKRTHGGPFPSNFRWWHAIAFLYICAVCAFVLLTYINLLRMRSML